MTKTVIYALEELPTIITQLQKLMQQYRIFAIKGSLGAGKTTLVRTLLQACGVQGVVASPTFTYVNIYTNKQGHKFYHFDLYRIQSPQEFIDAGFDEYLNDSEAYIFIEWPEVIEKFLNQHKVCTLDLEYISEDQRSIVIIY